MQIFNSKRLEERNEGLETLKNLNGKNSKVLIIHYSCESFFNTQGRTPRVTAICIKNRVDKETKSFSIHLKAEKHGFICQNMTDEEYRLCEKDFLNDFFQYLKIKKGYSLVHWRMRNAKYGFEAISNRFEILSKKSNIINILDNSSKYDLSILFEEIYSKYYEHDNRENGGKGRILNLARRNQLSTRFCLTGEGESEAFEAKKYLKMHDSTLQKVEILDYLFGLAASNKLKVASTAAQIFGVSLGGISEIVRNNRFFMLILLVLGYFLQAGLEPIVQRIFKTNELTEIEKKITAPRSVDSLASNNRLNKF